MNDNEIKYKNESLTQVKTHNARKDKPYFVSFKHPLSKILFNCGVNFPLS